MKGKEIYALGKESPAADAIIPLVFTHTAPRIRFKGDWQAEFWYFFKDADTIFAPQFYMVLKIPSGHLVAFQTLEGDELLGSASETNSQQFYDALNRYLELCDRVVLEEKFLRKLAEEWLTTLPRALRNWFQNLQPSEFVLEKKTNSSREILAEKLAEAIRAGDGAAIRKIQQEIRKERHNHE